jgi:hypothetical protein
VSGGGLVPSLVVAVVWTHLITTKEGEWRWSRSKLGGGGGVDSPICKNGEEETEVGEHMRKAKANS